MKVNGKAIGPGFESQVPHILQYYFVLYNHALVQAKRPPWTIIFQPSDYSQSGSKGHHMKDHDAPWSMHNMESESQMWANGFWAQNLLWRPPQIASKQAQYSFSLFFYLIYLNYFTNTKINSFIKNHKINFSSN